MNSYTGYVLVAYGVTVLVIIANIVTARRRFHAIQQRLKQHLARRAGRAGTNESMVGRQS